MPNLQTALTTNMPPPIPDMKANNSNGPITVSSSTSVNVTAALDTGYFEKTNADWWILAYVADLATNWTGWFYMGPTGEWLYYDPAAPNVDPVLQTSLFALNPTTIWNSTLPPGYTYTFYFGVDLSMNTPKGLIDDPIYLDSVTITVPAITSSTATRAAWTMVPIFPEKIGVFSNGAWYLDANGNDIWDGSPVDYYFSYGAAPDKPVMGDWNGDGIDTVGTFSDGYFYLRNFNSSDYAETSFAYGLPGDIPIAGDWNGDSIDTIGVFRNGTFHLSNTHSGTIDLSFTFGQTGDTPLAGDWNGDGTDTVGVFRNGTFYLSNTHSGTIDLSFTFGQTGDTPLAGDWNGDGKSDVGVSRNGTWLLDLNGNRIWEGCESGQPDGCTVFGLSGDKPVVGRWDSEITNMEYQYLGDVNITGTVNLLDVVKIKRMASGADAAQLCADINDDLTINLLDVVKAKRMAAGTDPLRRCNYYVDPSSQSGLPDGESLMQSPETLTPSTVSIPTDITGDPGQTVDIPINVDNATDVAGYQFTITYDPSVITCTAALKGSLTQDWDSPTASASIPGQITSLSLAPNLTELSGGSGSLAIIRCTAANNPEAGTSLHFAEALLSDNKGTAMIATTTDGSFAIKPAP